MAGQQMKHAGRALQPRRYAAHRPWRAAFHPNCERPTMKINRPRFVPTRAALASAALMLANGVAFASDAMLGIEKALQAALTDKRGITLYVGGQPVGGAVTRIEPGQWVELRNQQHGRIIVRLDRIDGVAMP